MKLRPCSPAIGLALALACGSSLVGCGGSDSNKSTLPAPTATAPSTADSTGGVTAATDNSASSAPATGSDSPAAPGANTAASCESMWTKYLTFHPAGLITAYRATSLTKDSAGATIQQSVSEYEETVTESNARHVVSSRTLKIQGLPTPVVQSTELTKDQFITGCTKANGSIAGGVTGLPADVSVQITEKSTQSITVTGGTFTTDFVRGVANDLSTGTTNFQTWSLQDGSGILVKTMIETNTDVGGATMTGSITTELTKIVRP